ncbi:MAG: lipopolysaccharide kinase InaA family protein [Acidimicrobiales bacterium]
MDGLTGVGVDLAELEPAAVDARGSTPYFGTTTDGHRLFVKVLGEDERSADLLFRMYRRVLPCDLGDERPFSSLRRAVEHEALVALAARDAGVRTPRLVAFAACEPASFVLAYEAIEGASWDRFTADELTPDKVTALWELVQILRRHRIAHRDLRLANLFLGADGEVWLIDFGFSELAASDTLLATDLAELLTSMASVVGPEASIAAGYAAVGDDIVEALPRLRSFVRPVGRHPLGGQDDPELLPGVGGPCGRRPAPWRSDPAAGGTGILPDADLGIVDELDDAHLLVVRHLVDDEPLDVLRRCLGARQSDERLRQLARPRRQARR